MTSDDIDDFLSDIGLGAPEPSTPESEFFDMLTAPPAPRIGTIRYFVMHQMSMFQFLREKEVQIQTKQEHTINTVNIPGAMTVKGNITAKNALKDLDQLGYAKLILEYYLLMHHLPRFRVMDDNKHRSVCSMSKVVDMLAEHPEIQGVIYKRY